MLQRSLAGLVAMLVLVACGGVTSGSPSGPTAATIAVQPGDLPADMHKCALSGDIDSFLNKSKTKDPNTYTATKGEWDSAKQKGATAAYAAFYTDSTAHCASIETNSSDISSATYKLVVNFVVQFKETHLDFVGRLAGAGRTGQLAQVPQRREVPGRFRWR